MGKEYADGIEFAEVDRFVTFDAPGEFILGQLIGYTLLQPDGTGKVFGQFTVMDEDGMVRFNETAQLSMLKAVEPGTFVRIQYNGEQGTRAGLTVKTFIVQIDKRKAKDVAGMILQHPEMLQIGAAGVSQLAE